MASNIIHFIDTETTGLDHNTHEVISVGMVSVLEKFDGADKSHETLEELEVKIKPEKLDLADPVSLSINGFTEEDWISGLAPKDAAGLLYEKLENAIVVGHNIMFDVRMLMNFFRNQGISWKPVYTLDTVKIARSAFGRDVVLDSYSLASLCNYYAIENENAHSALSDARACFELYKRLIQKQ